MKRIALAAVSIWAAACSSVPDATHSHPAADTSVLEQLLKTPSFKLTNSYDKTVSSDELIGKVWLVNFIFTRCTGPCPLMTQRMKEVQDALRQAGLVSADSPVRLVSISVDPDYDTPEVLRRYAETWKADPANWEFLTGPPDETLRLVREGFKITADREGSGPMGIVHGTSFLLVDSTGWVRRIFRMDEPDFVAGTVSAIQELLERRGASS